MHVYLKTLAMLAAGLVLGCAAEDFDASDWDGDGGGWGGSTGAGGQLGPRDSGFDPPDGGEPGSDAGTPCRHVLTPLGCLETMTDVCDYVAQLGDCVDRDGDCFVSECSDVEPELYLPILDCGQDDDPDVHPMASEICDGKDNNCKDGTDEEIGRAHV